MFRDRDYIETDDGYLFSVIGNVHPVDSVISYLKYVPTDEGTPWRRGSLFYRRALSGYSADEVSRSIDRYLKGGKARYISFDEFFGTNLIKVPIDAVTKHFLPEDRLASLVIEAKDELEIMAVELASLLSERSDIEIEDFGVTGSILLGIHNIEISDIDLIVYGLENSWRLRDILVELLDSGDSGLSRLSGETLLEYSERISSIHELSSDEAAELYEARFWNRGAYKGRFFSIHPVLCEWEVEENYGDKMYKFVDVVEIRARITDNRYSLFNPAIYCIDDVEVVKGKYIDDIRELASYEGLYAGIFDEDERVYVRGKLEYVEDYHAEDRYYRVVVGSFELEGSDYIKPVEWVS